MINDPMSEAARKTMSFLFRQMLEHEPGTLAGTDINELHDMRVAVRRMRAALRVFKGFFDGGLPGPYIKMLAKAGNVLGAVRDLDVFHEKVHQFVDTLSGSQKNQMKPLLKKWQTERELRQSQMVAFLKSKGYAGFKRAFSRFLDKPFSAIPVMFNGKPVPYRVCNILPGILFRSYARVCVYDEWLIGKKDVPLVRYHQLRIASKRLRYTLEFFKDVIGPDAKHLIKKVTLLQGYLGELHDADVACNILRNFLTTGRWSTEPNEVSPGNKNKRSIIDRYLLSRENEIRDLAGDFPLVWSKISGDEFRRRICKIATKILV